MSRCSIANLLVAELLRCDFLVLVLDADQSQDDVDLGDCDCAHSYAMHKEWNEQVLRLSANWHVLLVRCARLTEACEVDCWGVEVLARPFSTASPSAAGGINGVVSSASPMASLATISPTASRPSMSVLGVVIVALSTTRKDSARALVTPRKNKAVMPRDYKSPFPPLIKLMDEG